MNNFAGKQQRVDAWVDKAPFGYREYDKIFDKIREEIGETQDALELHLTSGTSNDLIELEKEIGDILFAIICLANTTDKKPKISLDECLELVSHETACEYGGYYHIFTAMTEIKNEIQAALITYVTSNDANDLKTLKKSIGHLLITIIGLTDKLKISTDECFDLMMDKNEKRAKNNYQKEEK